MASVGKACHITAAAPGPGARRYDASLTRAERRSYANGTWMCSTCGDLIDRDAVKFTAELLASWKTQAEARAHRRLGVPESRAPHAPSVLFDDIVASVHAAELVGLDSRPVGFRCELTTNVLVAFESVGVSCTDAGPGGIVDFLIWTRDGIVALGAATASSDGAVVTNFRVPYHRFLQRGTYVFEARVVGGARCATWVSVPDNRPAPEVHASPAVADIEGEVHVAGAGFPPNDRIEVDFLNIRGSMGVGVGDAMTDAHGRFELVFRVPAFEGRGFTPAGRHPVRAHGFRCGAETFVEVRPNDWTRLVVQRVNYTDANGFFSINVREIGLGRGRIALRYALLNKTTTTVELHRPTVDFRGPDYELLGTMLAADDYSPTPEAMEPRLGPGQLLTVHQEFALVHETQPSARVRASRTAVLCLRIGAMAAGQYIGIDAVLQLDEDTVRAIAADDPPRADAEQGR